MFEVVYNMKKVFVGLAIAFALILLTCVFPFGGFKAPNYQAMQMGDKVSYYNTIVWQYSYSYISAHNDHSITMRSRFCIFDTFIIYEKDEKMMYDPSGGITEWTFPSVVDHIE